MQSVGACGGRKPIETESAGRGLECGRWGRWARSGSFRAIIINCWPFQFSLRPQLTFGGCSKVESNRNCELCEGEWQWECGSVGVWQSGMVRVRMTMRSKCAAAAKNMLRKTMTMARNIVILSGSAINIHMHKFDICLLHKIVQAAEPLGRQPRQSPRSRAANLCT